MTEGGKSEVQGEAWVRSMLSLPHPPAALVFMEGTRAMVTHTHTHIVRYYHCSMFQNDFDLFLLFLGTLLLYICYIVFVLNISTHMYYTRNGPVYIRIWLV